VIPDSVFLQLATKFFRPSPTELEQLKHEQRERFQQGEHLALIEVALKTGVLAQRDVDAFVAAAGGGSADAPSAPPRVPSDRVRVPSGRSKTPGEKAPSDRVRVPSGRSKTPGVKAPSDRVKARTRSKPSDRVKAPTRSKPSDRVKAPSDRARAGKASERARASASGKHPQPQGPPWGLIAAGAVVLVCLGGAVAIGLGGPSETTPTAATTDPDPDATTPKQPSYLERARALRGASFARLDTGQGERALSDLDALRYEWSDVPEAAEACLALEELRADLVAEIARRRGRFADEDEDEDEGPSVPPPLTRFDEVDEEAVAEVLSIWTGIPVYKLTEEETAKLLRMEDVIGNRVIGQEQAVQAVSKAVRRARAGLQDPNRPLGSFLFLGPTGVGKTELTKALAEFLFDDDTAMVRIDMSEFMEKHAVSRLIGAPPGYVGYDEGGVLTEAVRRRPYQVVLFDEVEKAHQDVFNVLLQVLDDGRLTDGQGRVVDFSNTLIILTSNLGSQYLANLDEGQTVEDVEPQVMEVVRAHFRPEFLNRLDEIILFHRLAAEHMAPIVEIQVGRVQKLLKDRKIVLDLTDAAKRWLGRVGYDPVYGARPLKRAVQRYLQDPLAEKLLAGEIPDGSMVKIDEGDGALEIAVG